MNNVDSKQKEQINFKIKVMSDIIVGLSKYAEKTKQGYQTEDERKLLEDELNKYFGKFGVKDLSLEQLREIYNAIKKEND